MINKEVELIIDKICRCCMCENEDMHNVFEDKKDSQGPSTLLSEMLIACVSVEVAFGDGLPSNICDTCKCKLNTAYEFRQQCQKSDSTLRELTNTDSKTNITKQEEIVIQPDIHDDMFDEEDDLPLKQGIIKRKRGRSKKKPDNNNYACTFCHAALQTKKELKEHLKAHTGDKIRQCLFCDAKYIRTNHFIRHINTHDKPGLIHPCENCDKTFTVAAELYEHHKQEHEEKEKRDIKQEEMEVKPEINSNTENTTVATENKTEHVEVSDHNDTFSNYCSFSDNDTDEDDGVLTSVKRKRTSKSTKKEEQDKMCNKTFTKLDQLSGYVVNQGIAEKERLKEFKGGRNNGDNPEHTKSVNDCSQGSVLPEDGGATPDSENYLATSVNSRNHTCHVCGACFGRANHLTRHMTLHRAILVHQCDKCEKAFATEEHLKKHSEERHFNKPYMCTECNRPFSKGEYLIRHLKIHQTNSNKETNIKCSICEATFTEPDLLVRHTKIHLLQDRRREGNGNQKNSKKIQSGMKDTSKLHLCIYCGKEFSNSSNMIVHMRRHTGEMPYKCKECGKGFPRSHDLKGHERTHSGEKPYLCTLCGKSFSKSNKLLRHSRVHTGERPYVCNICGHAFTQSNDLSMHMRRHTGVRPYTCGVCPARFIQSGQLTRHRKSTGHWMKTQPDLKGGYRVELVTPAYEPIPIRFKSHGSTNKEKEEAETRVTELENVQNITTGPGKQMEPQMTLGGDTTKIQNEMQPLTADSTNLVPPRNDTQGIMPSVQSNDGEEVKVKLEVLNISQCEEN